MRRSVAIAAVFLVAVAVGSNAIAGKRFNLTEVSGRYVLSTDGDTVGAGRVAASGYLLADGNGNIYDAKRIILNPLGAVTEAFTCAVSIDADGMGSAECELDEAQSGIPFIETFDFVIAGDRQSFRFVGTTPGLVVSGTGNRQSF